MSRFNGGTTKGNWTVFAADWAPADLGTLNQWSIIVTPTHFACAAVPLVPIVTATKTVSGSVSPGGAVTYTVVLTNSGLGAQADNPGNEFTDVLPASLTLVSANATSGTAVATVGTNTVTWNGAIAAGASVTITIQATIDPAAVGGTIVSNQGTASYDSDGNNTNNASALTDDPGTVTPGDPTSFTVVGGAGSPPVLQSAASRKVHGAAGPFDLALTLTTPPTINHNPTTEPRAGPAFQLVFTFDKPINAATVTVTEGTATAAGPTFSGNDVVVNLSAVADRQYVTVSLTSVGSTDGGTGGVGAGRVGFLTGDVNRSRIVAVTDLVAVNNQLAKPLTVSNFLTDVNVSGIVSNLDKVFVNNNLAHFLPAP